MPTRIDTRPLELLTDAEGGSGGWCCAYDKCLRNPGRRPPFTQLTWAVKHVYGHYQLEVPEHFLSSWCRFCSYWGSVDDVEVHYERAHSGSFGHLPLCHKCCISWQTRYDHETRWCPAQVGKRIELYGREWDKILLEYDYSTFPEVEILCYPKPPPKVLAAVDEARKEEFARRRQAAAERKARILAHATREELEESVKRRVRELEQRREVRHSWDAERLLEEDIAHVRAELGDYDLWKDQPGTSSSLSKTRVRLTARQQYTYQRFY